jgi:hypothetical protein
MKNRLLRRSNRAVLAGGILLSLHACGGKPKDETVKQPVTQKVESSIAFEDTTAKAGINFKHVNGAFGKKWLPETMGSGLAWIDYDGDGFQDLFLVNGREWTAEEKALAKQVSINAPGGSATCKLYKNNGNGTFTDVTSQTKLGISLYGMGVAVGDYDNDGHTDLYVTGLGRNYLFHNNGDGTFKEVATEAGVKDGGWSTSTAWFDYDKDGKLDLIVAHYVIWSPATDIPFPRNGHPTYGTPGQYVGEPLRLYHNEGNGKFTDVSEKAGIRKNSEGRNLQGKSLGLAMCDYDKDGYPDVVIANDTELNYLLHNQKNGTFKEIGVETSMAAPDNGVPRGAMGIDACDYDNKGRESLVMGNFSNQGLTLYHNEGAVFRDVAAQSGLLQPTLLSLTFGCFFLDMDNDGWRDIFIANGHVDDDIQEVQKTVEYAEKPHLFRNTGSSNFQEVTAGAGSSMNSKYVSRGAAYADFELTGKPGIAMTTNNGQAFLFRNTTKNGNQALRLELEGTKSNRSAIGAYVQVEAGGVTQTYMVRSGSSYCSQSELPLTIGIGTQKTANITIVWPSGEKSTQAGMAVGQIYHIVEGKGIADQRPFGQPIAKKAAKP